MLSSEPEKDELAQMRQRLFSIWNAHNQPRRTTRRVVPAPPRQVRPQAVQNEISSEIQQLIQEFANPEADKLILP